MVDTIAHDIAEALLARVGTEWQRFIDEDGFSKVAAEAAFEEELEQIGFDLTELPNEVYNAILNHEAVKGAFDEMRIEAEEKALDRMEYHKAMTGSVYEQLRYHGMSVHDFV